MTRTKPALTRSRPDIASARTDLTRTKPDLRIPLTSDPTPDPLADVDYGHDIETDSAAETSALLEGFRQRAREETNRFYLATDAEFWFAVCFQSQDQKDAFLAAVPWDTDGADKYIDGTKLARQLGIPLPVVTLPKREKRIDPAWTKLVKR